MTASYDLPSPPPLPVLCPPGPQALSAGGHGPQSGFCWAPAEARCLLATRELACVTEAFQDGAGARPLLLAAPCAWCLLFPVSLSGFLFIVLPGVLGAERCLLRAPSAGECRDNQQWPSGGRAQGFPPLCLGLRGLCPYPFLRPAPVSRSGSPEGRSPTGGNRLPAPPALRSGHSGTFGTETAGSPMPPGAQDVHQGSQRSLGLRVWSHLLCPDSVSRLILSLQRPKPVCCPSGSKLRVWTLKTPVTFSVPQPSWKCSSSAAECRIHLSFMAPACRLPKSPSNSLLQHPG